MIDDKVEDQEDDEDEDEEKNENEDEEVEEECKWASRTVGRENNHFEEKGEELTGSGVCKEDTTW